MALGLLIAALCDNTVRRCANCAAMGSTAFVACHQNGKVHSDMAVVRGPAEMHDCDWKLNAHWAR